MKCSFMWHFICVFTVCQSTLLVVPNIPLEFPIKFDTVKPRWTIIYIEGSQVIIFKNLVFLSMKMYLVLAISADPDEMQLHVAFHLCLHCLPKYSISGSQYTNGISDKI